MHARSIIECTKGKCKGCNGRTPLVNMLTLEMPCRDCFDEWRKSGQLMGKSKVTVYMLEGRLYLVQSGIKGTGRTHV